MEEKGYIVVALTCALCNKMAIQYLDHSPEKEDFEDIEWQLNEAECIEMKIFKLSEIKGGKGSMIAVENMFDK